MTSSKVTAKDQTYVINCGIGGTYPVGNKVRVRLEDTNKPLEIAEIIVEEYMLIGNNFFMCILLDDLLDLRRLQRPSIDALSP